jgi:hypothetical protein
VNSLEASLLGMLDSPGVIGVALVDAVTGLTYAAAGEPAGDAGPELAELAALVAARLGEAGATGELENIVVTSGRHHHVVQLVECTGDPLLLSVLLDRERTNVALALRQAADDARKVLV